MEAGERRDHAAVERRPSASMYRAAADQALEQLDWCVEYLYRIRKPQIAEVIAKNRTSIRRDLHGE